MIFFLILILFSILIFYFITNSPKTKNYSKIPTKEEMVELIMQQKIAENLEKTLHKKFTVEELANEALRQIKQNIIDYFISYNCNFLKFNTCKEFFDDNICPYCECKFDKKHDKKFKCNNCQNEIFVKNSLFEKHKLYLTQRENKIIEAYKPLISERKSILKDLLYFYEEDIINIKNKYEKCTEKTIEEIDIMIGITQQAQIDNKQYGLFRNTTLQRYYFTKCFSNEILATSMFFSVLVLDINNADNIKPYFSKSPNIYPKIKEELLKNIKYNKLQITDVKELFFSVYSGTEKIIQRKLAYDVNEAWNILEAECFLNENSNILK